MVTYYILDLGSTLDSKELPDSQISKANRSLSNDSTRDIPTSYYNLEYSLLSK